MFGISGPQQRRIRAVENTRLAIREEDAQTAAGEHGDFAPVRIVVAPERISANRLFAKPSDRLCVFYVVGNTDNL